MSEIVNITKNELVQLIRYINNKMDLHRTQHLCKIHDNENACKELVWKDKDLDKAYEKIKHLI